MKLGKPIAVTMNRWAYIDFLKANKFKSVGSGLYADVFARPKDDYVIKVGGVRYNSWDKDGYVGFLKRINPNNPLFPKIRAVQLCQPINDDPFYVVEMERLLKFSSRKIDSQTKKSSLQNLGLSKIWDLESYVIDKLEESEHKHMQGAAKILSKLYHCHMEDIHDGNIMWRQNGNQVHLVITDPCV